MHVACDVCMQTGEQASDTSTSIPGSLGALQLALYLSILCLGPLQLPG